MTQIFNTLVDVVPVVVTSLITVLAVIAPLTSSTVDNKVLDVLRFIEDKILSVLFPSLVKQTQIGTPMTAEEIKEFAKTV